MTRMLTVAGVFALGAVLMYGAAQASPAYYHQSAPGAAATGQASSPQPLADWHYEWRYQYGKWGEFMPGWVPVLNNA
jgi:hypothetical protein